MQDYWSWLNEMTLQDLIKSTEKAEDHERTLAKTPAASRSDKANEVSDISVSLEYIPGNRQKSELEGMPGEYAQLLVSGKVSGAPQRDGSRAIYEPQILFRDVFFFDNPDLFVAKQIKVKTRQRLETKWIEMPHSGTHDVKVKCDCQDFIRMWHNHNFISGSLHGNRLEMPSPSPERRPRNPLGSPGICKHLFALMRFLQGNNPGKRSLLS
jgi:hypothetical protein